MKSLEKFDEWRFSNSTHIDRLMNITRRHVENMNMWVRSFKMPIGSPEFIKETYRLYREISGFLDEYKETFDSLKDDMQKFVEVLNVLEEEMIKVSEAKTDTESK